ncbi:MAG: MerR family transcriptional regulator [Acidimicrobiales bacterium]|jgi:DNA-binding transcriptional MerR regulator
MARRTDNTTGTNPEQTAGATGPVDGFRGAQVCAVVGITYRQLDYWARTGLLRPSLVDATGSGSKRRYSYGDVLELKVIKRLLDAGLKLQQARQAVECLRGDLGVDLASAQLVLADNRSILATSGGELVDLLAGGQGVFNVLPLSGVVSELEAAIVELTAPVADRQVPDERHPAAAYLAAGGNARH